MPPPETRSAALTAYLAAMRLIGPIAAPMILRRRLARGKEDPARWPERLARAPVMRPEGPLIWLHAVGLGEVLALRGLIRMLGERLPEASFLITSIARSSAQVVGANLPPRTQHRYLPMDVPAYARAFLDAWRPDLSVWSEQDIWPAHLLAAQARGIPCALINARMDAAARARRARAGGSFARLLSAFDLIGAQDGASAENLASLGGQGVFTHPSLKRAAPPLGADPAALAALRAALAGRAVWCAASTHPEDEAVALAARPEGPLLVLVPRLPDRGAQIAADLAARAIPHSLASRDGLPRATDAVHIDDAFGRLGLWYRLAPRVLMGGTFGPVQGHNPWEALALGASVLHGPNTANFATDYADLDTAGAATCVGDAAALSAALATDPGDAQDRAEALMAKAEAEIAALADRLAALAITSR